MVVLEKDIKQLKINNRLLLKIIIIISKMANNNKSISINNTATESLLLNEPQANSTPITSNKVSLEDLFQLMKVTIMN